MRTQIIIEDHVVPQLLTSAIEAYETLAQRDALSDSGCKHFQGYLFGKPVAVADFEVTSLSALEVSTSNTLT